MTEEKIETPLELPAIKDVVWLHIVHQTPFSILAKGLVYGRESAIKMATSSRYSQRIIKEQTIVFRLLHANIIEIVGHGETDQGLSWMAYSWIAGLRAQEFVLSKGAPLNRHRNRHALVVLHQMADALAHMHSRDVAHLDIKSDNVLVDANGKASLIDFGTAQVIKGDSWKQPFHGTPVYASPERLNGHPFDQKADIYSLGVLASRLLTGRIPSSRGFSQPWLANLIADLICFEPEKRPSAEVLVNRFSMALASF